MPPITHVIRRATALGLIVSSAAIATFTSTAHAQGDDNHPGKKVYDSACAACHNNPEATKAPGVDTLRGMRFQALSYALTEGKMKTQAAGLSEQQRGELIGYLIGEGSTKDTWVADMMCPAERRTPDLKQDASVAGFGFDKHNTRSLSAEQAGLSTKDFSNLELAWVMAFPKATTMRSQAAIVGKTMFLPVAETNSLYALDISSATPCVQWAYSSDAPLRTSAAYGELSDGRKVLAFSDLASMVHLVDAQKGEVIWKQHIAVSEFSITTGTPIIHNDVVIAPVSQYEISLGAQPKHKCCTSHGAVTAINAMTGEKLWTAHTMEDAKPIRDRGDGQMIYGPSGAPIWNSPAVDAKRGLVYVGTGEATSEPAHKNTDAILAIDLKTGDIKWSFQATENDIFLMGCGPGRKGPNCPLEGASVYRDVDFGASMILAQRKDGSEVVLGGQKSGTVWALNPDNGKVEWRQDFGEGSPLGGIHWGLAFDGERVFAPINRPYGFGPASGKRDQKPGMHALDVNTGKVLWTFAAEPDCSGDRKQRMRICDNNIGLSGAPTVIDGAVLAGGLDGILRAFDAKTGKVLFSYDTAQNFKTINGVEGNGGSIDNASIVAGNGYVFVNSGYGMFGQVPGNVMLAFKVKGSK